METRTLQVILRVLYTVNNNPQYILAKSSSQVPVIPCNESTAQPAANEPAYARAPLKACLAVVCDSSPELLQDPARDFSLYFLDPLEAQPLPTGLAHAPHNTSSPRGVAVALGLMSRALESSDSTNVFVTGTIIPSASPALEVVCALRETKRMPKPTLHSYPPLGPIPTLVTSQLHHPPHPFQPAGMNWLFNSHPQLDQRQTLTRSADFPEVYIGPPRRARGRPEGSTSSKSKVKAQARSSSPPGPSSSDAVGQSEPKQTVVRGSKQKTKPRPPRPPPTYSPFICAPLTRNIGTTAQEGDETGVSVLNQLSHLKNDGLTKPSQNQPHVEPDRRPQSHLHPTHDLLVGLLSALSSTSRTSTGNTAPEQQATLMSVLQGLLTSNSHFIKPATGERLPANIGETTPKDTHGNNTAGDEHDDGDSDVVILDSSTIDTTIFRKASAKHPSTGDQGTGSSPLPASTPPSVPENTSVSSQTLTPSDAPESILTVTVDSETPKRNFSSWEGKGDNAPDVPTTPTPSRTRKRKLDEYNQDQAHWSMPLSPSSPSPSVVRTSSSRRVVTLKNQTQSSPTGGPRSISSPSVRLPSMLASMRGIATSNAGSSRSSIPSMHEHTALLATKKTGNQSTALVSKPRPDHGIPSASSSLKRRRTLSEFMAEQEARKNLKLCKQSHLEWKLGTEVSTDALLHPALSRPDDLQPISKYSDSSPSRPLFRSDSMVSALQPPALTSQSGIMPTTANSTSTSSSTITLTSNGSSTSTSIGQTKNPFKNFVVPAWARTSTATLPRLSEETLARQKAEQEAKKAQASLRRREAARAKRKQRHRADSPSKDSSDEDNEIATGDIKQRSLLPLSSSPARDAPIPKPPTLPVFASDGVAPIATSPPRSHSQSMVPTVPSTPPKKFLSLSGSGSRHTPSKSGSCSLFTPSGQDSMSLFTPSTPSVTQSLTRSRFTPRSPTALRCAGGAQMSPRKGVLQTPRTPRRNESDQYICTPRNPRTDRHLLFGSPSLVNRTPQTQTGMGTRTFLLPPPSPCTLRTAQGRRQVSGSTPTMLQGPGTLSQVSSRDAHTQEVQRKDCEEVDDTLKLTEALVGNAVSPPAKPHPRRNSEPNDINPDGDADLAEEASSPLPPSSPLPASPLSSPGTTKYHDNHALHDANGQRAADAAWLLSDDSIDPTAAWFTDSDAGAWLTETEAWLTDTEGEPLPTDSDGAWLSDSGAVSSAFGNLGSSLQNWLSDEADLEETDGEVDMGMRAMHQDDAGFGTDAFRRAYESLVEHGEGSADANEALDGNATLGPATPSDTGLGRPIGSDFWDTIKPLMGDGALNDEGTAPGAVHDVHALLDSLVGT